MKTFEYNPDRGTYYEMDDHHDGGLIIKTKQDTTPVLEMNKADRNSGINDKVGEFNHYARIPAAIELALRQKGLNIYVKNQTKRVESGEDGEQLTYHCGVQFRSLSRYQQILLHAWVTNQVLQDALRARQQ